MTATAATPQFKEGDRVFSHYVMKWGTIQSVDKTTDPCPHGVTGDMLPGSTWYTVLMDNGRLESLDDGGGDWDLCRIMPPRIASRFGWPADPKAGTLDK